MDEDDERRTFERMALTFTAGLILCMLCFMGVMWYFRDHAQGDDVHAW